MQKNRYN